MTCIKDANCMSLGIFLSSFKLCVVVHGQDHTAFDEMDVFKGNNSSGFHIQQNCKKKKNNTEVQQN